MLTSAWVYTLIPAFLAISAAVMFVRLRPGPVMVSAIQHFAAGVVFAAAAAEILPDVVHGGSVMAILVGGTAGVLLMLGIKQLETLIKGPAGLLTMIGVDLLIDGLILGIGFAVAVQTGLLLTVALSLEVIFLGLALVIGLSEEGWSARKIIISIIGLMALLPVGAVMAAPVALMSAPVIAGFLAFGLMALLYLVTEELLIEAHETPDTPWVTAMFFAGFLILLMLEEVMA